jgi:hypothetical protein
VISGAKKARAHWSQRSRGRVVDQSELLKLASCEERAEQAPARGLRSGA